MHIAIVHHEVHAQASQDDRDVLVQVDCVQRSLVTLGHEVSVIGCSLDLDRLRNHLQQLQPDVVFNLVETLGQSDRLAPLAPLLFETIGQPYTGAPADTLWLTTSKLATKKHLRDAGLPTADWLSGDHDGPQTLKGPFILKAVFEHASFGMDDSAVIDVDGEFELRRKLSETAARLRRPCFAEQYIDGREFNLSLLCQRGGVQVLPPAEIRFEGFAAGQPKIVGYQAKWAADSPEYLGTPRTFDFPATDQRLLDQLRSLAETCWQRFALRGYARVDFRVDQSGQPWILEINANPCLSPDAGFAAALRQAGVPWESALDRILHDACMTPA